MVPHNDVKKQLSLNTMQGTPNFSHPEHALHLYDPACKVCPPCRAISLFCKTLQELPQLNGRNGTYCGCGAFAQGSDASSGIASAATQGASEGHSGKRVAQGSI